MQNYKQLLDLLDYPKNTQLMKQKISLFGLKYLRINDLMLIHSYYEKAETKSQNPLFSAPAKLVSAEKIGNEVELTIKTLKDAHDPTAIALVRGLNNDQIEVAYSHLAPELLTPKVKKDGWDNWVFSYQLSMEEKLAKRRQITRSRSLKAFRALKDFNFENKNLLFLGCGDGIEIETFITSYNLTSANIVGLDYSANAIEECKKLISSFPLINFEFKQLDLTDLSSLKDKKLDLIIALGVFDRETLSFEDGIKCLAEIRNSLNFDLFLSAGYSFDLFSAENYKNLGFDVLATCEPDRLYTADYNFFYLLKNSPRTASEITDVVGAESTYFYI